MHLPNFGHNKPFYFQLQTDRGLEWVRLSEVYNRRYWWWVHQSSTLCGVLKYEGGVLVFKDSGSFWGKYLEEFREALVTWYG